MSSLSHCAANSTTVLHMESEDFLQSLAFVEAASIQFCDWDDVEADYEGPARISDKCSGRGHSGLVLLGDGDNPFGNFPLFCRMFQFYPGHFRVYKRLTTTGLTLADVETIPGTFLLWRSMMQYLGGAGIAIIMMSAILGPAGLGLKAEGRIYNVPEYPRVRRGQ